MAGQLLQGLQSFIASSNVTSLTYTGNPPVYSSGGIPQFSVVVDDSANTGKPLDVKLGTSDTVIPLGIAQNGPAVTSGDAVQVATRGRSKCVAAAAITVGQFVVCTTGGQVTPAPAAGATNVYLVGMAITAASAQGDLVEVELMLGATTQVNA